METLKLLRNVLIFISLVIFIKWLWGRRHLYMLSMKLKGPFSIPFIGSIVVALQFMTSKDSMKIVYENYKKYSGIHRLWILNDLIVAVFDPEDVKEVLCNSDAKPLMVAIPWAEGMGHGILGMSNNTENTTWRFHKNTLIQSLTPSCVKLHYKQMYKTSELLVKDINKIENKELVNIAIVLLRSCADVVVQTLYDTELDFRNGLWDHSIEAIDTSNKQVEGFCFRIGMTTYDRVVSPHLWYKPIYKFSKLYENEKKANEYIYDFAEAVYKSSVTSNSNNKNSTFEGSRTIDVLLKAEKDNKMTKLDVLNEIIHVWVAGFDTTGNSLAHLVLMLAMNKNCQDKAYKEIQNFFEKKDTIEWDDLDKFSYIDMCMKEALRLFPIGPAYFRYATKDIQLKSEKLTIPRGSVVGISNFTTMRDPKYWDDPLSFNPERFSPEEIAKRHPFSYIPFGGGLRKCIGTLYGKVLFKLHIIHFLRNFEVHSDRKFEELKLRFDFDTRVNGGHYVKVTPRNRVY